MAKDDPSVRRLVEDLSNAALRDLLRNVRHHTELRRRIATGQLDDRSVNVAYREYARREGAEYRRQAADLTLQYYSDLTDLGNRYSEQFYEEVLEANGSSFTSDGNGHPPTSSVSSSDDQDRDTSEQREEIGIELHGPPGREVLARFALENTEPRTVELSFDVGPCTGPAEEPFMAPLTIQPARLVLEPSEKRSITLRLALLHAVFTPGFLYRLPVYVRGPGNLVLMITIWAEEPAVGLVVDDVPPSTEVPSDAVAAASYVVRCPTCRRDFERSEHSTRLYPHKSPDGEACPQRRGRVRRGPLGPADVHAVPHG